MEINYIVHLKTFFFLARNDNRLTTSHLSLYVALFDVWNSYRFRNPFIPSRHYLMATSRIGSNSTYSKTMDELHLFGYIRQEKQNKYGQSQVTLLQLPNGGKGGQLPLFEESSPPVKVTKPAPEKEPDKGTKLERDKGTKLVGFRIQNDTHRVQFCTPCVPNLYPHINKHINIKINGSKQAPAPDLSFKNFFSEEKQTDGLAAAQNCTPNQGGFQNTESNSVQYVYPTLYESQRFFLEHESFKLSLKLALVEAEKFYNHYTAIGWKLGGVNPIQDWKAAARKWVLNNWRNDQVNTIALRQSIDGNNYHNPF